MKIGNRKSEGDMAIRKFTPFSDFQNIYTDIEIESLSFYLEKLYAQLGHMAEDFDKEIQSKAKEIVDEQDKDMFFEAHQEDFWHYDKVFPRTFLNSFLVAAYSLLEIEIIKIARRIGSKQKQPFDVSEIRSGGYLDTAIYYINKLTNIDISDKTFICLPSLKDGQRLRNIIVHSNGKVTKDSEIKLAKKCGVYDASEKEVTLTHDYCKIFIRSLKAFFAELYELTKAGNYL